MSAGIHHIVLERGVDWADGRFRYNAGTPQVIADLTGYSGRMRIRTSTDTDVELLARTTANGGMTLGGALGTVIVNLPGTQISSSLPVGTYVYDIIITSGGGVPYEIVKGYCVVNG